MEELLSLIKEEAEEEKAKILGEANNYRSELIKKAREEASSKLQAFQEKLEAQKRLEIQRTENLWELRRQAEILKAKSLWLENIKKEAMERLKALPSEPYYQDILFKLLEELLPEGDLILCVNRRDKDILLNKLKELGKNFSIQEDPSIIAGIKGITKDGKIQISNLLEDRLEKGWPQLIVNLASILWEGN